MVAGEGLGRTSLLVRGGKYHVLPEDFNWNGMCTKDAWILWCCGNAEKRYPPLKRLSVEDRAKRKNMAEVSVDEISVDHAVAVYKECEPVLYEIYKARHSKGRDRGQWRFSQLSWMTIIDNYTETSEALKFCPASFHWPGRAERVPRAPGPLRLAPPGPELRGSQAARLNRGAA
eukprot:767297-Hanusia_phi.AAC.1